MMIASNLRLLTLLLTGLSLCAFSDERSLLQLSDSAMERGIQHKHIQRSKKISGLHDSLGAGVCALDFNQDGWIDLFFVGGQGQHRNYGRDAWWAKKVGHRLYRNNGNGFFDDVSTDTLPALNMNGMACHAADLDRDGDMDLVVSGFKQSYLLINDNHAFKPLKLNVDNHWITSIAIADFDNNGLPDLHLSGFLQYDHTAKLLETQSGFTTGTPAAFQPQNFNGERNFFLFNQGNLQFVEQSQAWQAIEPDSRSLFTSILDANKDTKPDLLTSNAKGSVSALLLNQGDHFIKDNNGLDIPKNSINHTTLLNDDDQLSYFFTKETGQLPVMLKPYHHTIEDRSWISLKQHNDIANLNQINSLNIDIDSDGENDVFLANGFFTPDKDSYNRTTGQSNTLLLNKGNYFTPVQTLSIKRSSRGVITADINNDGGLDIIVSNNNDGPELYLNPTPPDNWLGLLLSTPETIQRIEVITDQRTLIRNKPSTSFLSSHDPRFVVALRKNEHVQRVDIIHYYGKSQQITSPPLKRYFGSPVAQNIPRPTPLTYGMARWQLIAEKINPHQMLQSFNLWNTEQQLAFLQDIKLYDTHQRLLGVVMHASKMDVDSLVLQSIDIFKAWENELTFTQFSTLLHSENPTISCAVADSYKHFYQQEEAMTETKWQMLPLLLQEMTRRPNACYLDAVAFSRAFRPVMAINQLLQNDTLSPDIQIAAIHALAELRHASSVNILKTLSENTETDIQQAANHAIGRIHGDIHSQTTPLPSQKTNECIEIKKVVTTTLERCSATAIASYFTERRLAIAGPELKRLKSPSNLTAQVFSLLHKEEAFNQLMQLYQKSQLDDSRLFYIQAIEYLNLNRKQQTLVAKLFDNTINKTLKIALGNILIHYQPEHVLAAAQGLFDE